MNTTEEIMKVNMNGVLTIPAKFRKFGFEVNSYVSVGLEDDGSLKIMPIHPVPKSQMGFHTKEWLVAEKKASEDLKAGNVKTYSSKEAFLKDIEKW